MSNQTTSGRTVTRVRHELKRRLLGVVAAERVTPHLIRITLGGDDLAGFTSPGFDDHVKIFLPPEGEVFDRLPEPGGPTSAMRDYTPHDFDPGALTLQLDFALHEAGPATAWAMRAKPGDRLGVGGPRGSFLVGTGFDWHLLIGDDTALPAIRRRLAELPAGSKALVIAEVHGPEDEEPFESLATVETHWVHRGGHDETLGAGGRSLLLEKLSAIRFPEGAYYAWVACESSEAKAIRAALLERGADRAALKAAGYWRRGAAATHDVHD